jgi:hypothetical protein
MNTGVIQMRAIVNLSTKKYWPGQARLIKSLKHKTDAALFMYRSEAEVGAPLHSENPYAFKVYAMEKAIEAGCQTILWLDASMYVLKDLTPLFEHIEKEGYFFQNSGWFNERWTNQKAKEYFGTNGGAMLSSGCIGFNLINAGAHRAFTEWKNSMLSGMFKGSWDDHRQDQTCISLIAYKSGLKLTENNTYFQYGKAAEPPIHENILLIADGIC